MLVEAQRQRPPGLDDDALDTLIASQIVPALPGRPEEEAEIMNAAIAVARFDEPGVVLGTLTPPLSGRAATGLSGPRIR